MNLVTLRNKIAADLEIVCKDFRLKNPLSDEVGDWREQGLTIFKQDSPPPRLDSDHSYHPFVIVKATGGNIVSNDEQDGGITLIISTWDDQDPTTGVDGVLNIIERIKNHYLANPILDSMFYCKQEMSYDIDEQANPYWYGAISMSWQIPKTNLMTGGDYV